MLSSGQINFYIFKNVGFYGLWRYAFLIKDSDDYVDYTVVINSLRVKTLMLTCLGHDIGVVRQT